MMWTWEEIGFKYDYIDAIKLKTDFWVPKC